MGGVQFSTLYLLLELRKNSNLKTDLLLPMHGQFSELCEKNSIPYYIYNSRLMNSSSLSFLNDSIRMPNPIAWIKNIINIYYNSISIRYFLKQHQNTIILSKGLYSHFTSIIANRRLENKLIWHLQDLISNRFGGLLLQIMNFLLKLDQITLFAMGILYLNH